MKKLFGVLTAGAVALSLGSCGDEETTPTYEWQNGTGVYYESENGSHQQVDRATVTVNNDVFDVKFEAFVMPSYARVEQTQYYTDLDKTGYEVVTAGTTEIFKYIAVDTKVYTFNETAYADGIAADSSYKYYNAYVAADSTTLADYENSALTDNAKGQAYVEAYEAGKIKIYSDASGTKSTGIIGRHGNLNKSHADSTYWPTTETALGWKGNIAKIEQAFEADKALFEVDFKAEGVTTDLAGATVGAKYTYADVITKAYDKLTKN